MVDYNLAIIGSGIAGSTAAIYASRANNDPIVIHGDEPGGQLTLTSEVENYPGFPEGINGAQLINNMQEQAESFGATYKHGIVESVQKDNNEHFEIELTGDETITANAVIVASGASARTLGIPGEDMLMGNGVSTCATCDGAFFRGEDMAVIGGGDAAVEEAVFLTKFADTVYLIHRRDEFRAEEYWQDTLKNKVNSGEIELKKNTEATEIHGSSENGVQSVTLVSHPKGHPKQKKNEGKDVETTELDVGAVFIAIGHTPNTDYLTSLPVELDDAGYIKTTDSETEQTKTGVDGLFAAGDVVDFHYQQAVTAAGMGSKAAIDADEYLSQ